uniref:transposase n=1 Tax=Vibrio tasmaniensis TaxID=212663 RepID=UPI00111A3CF5
VLLDHYNGAYDTKSCHNTLNNKGCTPLIPPRKNAAFWEDGHPRNEAVEALKNGTIAEGKPESGYHYRSISETAMSRYKGLTSGKLSLRCYNAQVGEIMANVNAINKVIGLGMPVRS